MDGPTVIATAWRHAIYALLIGSTLATTSGRIMSVTSRDHRTPFLSANDRSRWATVVALVDDGTYCIDRFQTDRSWQTIDKVWHANRQGEYHFYSSKPPLLATLVAGKYWLLQRITGLRLEQHPYIVGRALLWLINVPPLALYLILLTVFIERWGRTDWGRIYTVAAACGGTFLTTFAVTFNNHLPAAVAVVVALYAVWRCAEGTPPTGSMVLAGIASAFVVTCELPALSFYALIAAWCCYHDRRAFGLGFIPGSLAVAAAFFVTNYLAHGDWAVPYSHREWYDYPGSYWTGPRSGPDRGEPSRLWYLWHVLVGHHGLFSLTPIWCLAAGGAIRLCRLPGPSLSRAVAAATLVLTVVCVIFYVLRPEIDRNYGGVTCGLRWLFWLTPLGLLCLTEAADRWSLARRTRAIALVLLMISLFSAAYGWSNPWINPWPYQYAVAQGWIQG